jgi:hypothetical protein
MEAASTDRTAVIRAIPETGRKYRFAGVGPDGQALPWPDAEVRVKVVADPKPEEVKTWAGPGGSSYWVKDSKGILRPRVEGGLPTEVTEKQLADIMADKRITVRVLDGNGGDAQEVIEAKVKAAGLEERLKAAESELAAAAERYALSQATAARAADAAAAKIRELEAALVAATQPTKRSKG